eukprot:PRCOL_00001086-RA
MGVPRRSGAAGGGSAARAPAKRAAPARTCTDALAAGGGPAGGEAPALGERAARAREDLLRWYDANHRTLPWRAPPSETQAELARVAASTPAADERAYAVWVSEVMLQQTQVERVKEYYTRWMARWPTVSALADASEDDVQKAWAGLGYYRRSRFLHNGARHVASDLQGRLPRTAAELRAIPGIGEYTAGAIASIAFGQAVPAVDANVVRVVSRLAAHKGRGKSGAEKEHWALAQELVAEHRPGDLNQAIMELGATVCQAGRAQCGTCPIVAHCAAAKTARESGGSVQVTDFPAKVAKKAKRQELVGVLVVRSASCGAKKAGSDCRLLLSKRRDGGLLAGLWEFPSVVLAAGDGVSAASGAKLSASHTKALRAHASSLGLKADIALQHIGVVSHTFSHVQHHYVIHAVDVKGDSGAGATGDRRKWLSVGDIEQAGLSSGPMKVYEIWLKSLGRLK